MATSGTSTTSRAVVRDLGLDDRVRFAHTSRDRLGDVYSAADAVVFGVEWSEPFGLVPLEAMATGRPVAASGRGGSGEYLHDGANCVLFEPDRDGRALASALTRLADDQRLRQRIRDGGFATAAQLTEERFNRALARAVRRAAERGVG